MWKSSRLAFNAFKMRGIKVIIEAKVPRGIDTSSSARLRRRLASGGIPILSGFYKFVRGIEKGQMKTTR